MLDPLRDFPLVRDGYREGRAEGRIAGKAEGKAESVLTILEARGLRVTRALREKILACTDGDRLDRWLRSAASAASAAEVVGVH